MAQRPLHSVAVRRRSRPGVVSPSAPRRPRRHSPRSAPATPTSPGSRRRPARCPGGVRPPGFSGLLQAIVAQQISNQAAAAIWRRVVRPARRAASRRGCSRSPTTALRGAGLSRPKVAHARALAAAFAEGRLAAAALADMDDEDAVAAIIAVRGLGRWTAEVYLLFALGRDDVFPAGDLALAAAAAHLKGLPARPAPAALRALAETWRPHRGLAARLLWHHWRHVTGRAGAWTTCRSQRVPGGMTPPAPEPAGRARRRRSPSSRFDRPQRAQRLRPRHVGRAAGDDGGAVGRRHLRCVVLRGAGEAAFSAGADISAFAAERGSRAQRGSLRRTCCTRACSRSGYAAIRWWR